MTVKKAKASRLSYLPLTSFVQNVASRSPVPGGGSVAALSGSLGAALAVMVSRLSSTKLPEDKRAFFHEAEQESIELRDRLRELVDADAEAYEAVVAAAALPHGSEEEKRARTEALLAANHRAAEVPMGTMKACLEMMIILDKVARECFRGAMTDAFVAAQMLDAGFTGAMYNVRINLLQTDDEGFVKRMKERMETLLSAEAEISERLRGLASERLG